ncbi:phosphatase PAP2 family protein [Fulvivirga sedimenti]|uniref:Phosphatase PAP2 family protein n=1 Tax=Fulvivirga sedimenti TaxID=2879465 RepID=A0A9X1KZM2_9BACT|nr:phosphatase PAP2 family protein [Fulvivirga sedimenti]MCA6078440.1 phosphatase PAP2 family protein [Fulvivirga sedimenti]
MTRPDSPESSLSEVIRTFYENRREYILFVATLIVAAIVTSFLLNIFFEITEKLGTPELVQADDAISRVFFSYRSEKLTPLVTIITHLGSAPAYFILIPFSALILFLRGKRWMIAIDASLILISSSLLNTGLKNWIGRPRPLNELHLVEVNSLSFPSGHAMSAMAFYGFLIYLTYKYVENPVIRFLLIPLTALLILAIGASRIYLGVHYPSDVAAGLVAGLIWLIVCILIFRVFHFFRAKNKISSP